MRTPTMRLIAAVAGLAVLASACGGDAESTSDASGNTGSPDGSGASAVDAMPGQVIGDLNTVNTVEVQEGTGEVVIAIEKTIPNWNTLTASGDVSETVWVTTPIYPSVFVVEPDGSTITLNEDLMESAEVVGQDPTVVEYVIRDEAVWSDGTPISGADFEYQWRILNGRDCPDCQIRDTDGLDKVVDLAVSDDGKTVTATYDSNFAEWQRPFGRLLPAHIAEENGDLYASFNEHFVETVPEFSGGPYIITEYHHDVSVTLEPNPNWYGQTQPNLQSVTFRMITDAQQTPIALQNGEVQVMTGQPQVDLLDSLQQMEQLGVRYQINQSLAMETFQFNLSNSYLAEPALRKAIFTALDRQEVIDKTVGQFDSNVTPLGSMMVMQQQEGHQSKTEEFNYGAGDLEAAKAILDEAGYVIDDGQLYTPDGDAVPAFRSVYSVGSPVRQASFAVLQANVQELGITLNIETTDALGDTVAERSPYGYDIVIAGYIGSPFLASNAFKRFTTDTGYNQHYSDADVDRLVDEALAATSPEDVIDLINQADTITIEAAWMMPLYQRPSLIAYYENIGNIRDNSTISGPTYNLKDWGLTTS